MGLCLYKTTSKIISGTLRIIKYTNLVYIELHRVIINSIPIEYQVEPTSYIALKGVNELSYALDEEHLKEMFENLLIADMDSRKQSKVLSAYLEIIKQLNKDDAKLLKLLYENEYNVCAISLQVQTENQEGYSEYETLFNSVKNKYKLQESSSLSYEKDIIRLTNFGLNFIEICIS